MSGSEMASFNAFDAIVARRSAICAIVVRSTWQAIGCCSAWNEQVGPPGHVRLTHEPALDLNNHCVLHTGVGGPRRLIGSSGARGLASRANR